MRDGVLCESGILKTGGGGAAARQGREKVGGQSYEVRGALDGAVFRDSKILCIFAAHEHTLLFSP